MLKWHERRKGEVKAMNDLERIVPMLSRRNWTKCERINKRLNKAKIFCRLRE